jgi:lysozyme
MIRSKDCDNLVRKWEGYHKQLPNGNCTAYPDVAHGWRVATIGFGTTFYQRSGKVKYGRAQVRQGDVLTRAEAEDELDAELDIVENKLNELITAPVTQGMFDAMCSFAFNLGIAGAGKQIERINAGAYEECARAFDLYINANGRPFQGLINRRNDEEALFRKDGMNPIAEVSSVVGRPYAPCPVPMHISGEYKEGDRGDGVYLIQCALIGLGFLAKPKDGELVGDVFNEHVDYAVKQFQAYAKLKIDGIVGPKTRTALEAALTKARAPKVVIGPPAYCVFEMDLEPSQALRAGVLSFFDKGGNLVRKEPCTSGMPGYQTAAHLWTRGAGPVPPVVGQSIRFSDGYHLNTRGIEGWAFPMTPDPIMRNGQVGRSEIMLHRDANVPGTAGCLGLLLSKKDYDAFVAWAKPLKTMPLEVKYT